MWGRLLVRCCLGLCWAQLGPGRSPRSFLTDFTFSAGLATWL